MVEPLFRPPYEVPLAWGQARVSRGRRLETADLFCVSKTERLRLPKAVQRPGEHATPDRHDVALTWSKFSKQAPGNALTHRGMVIDPYTGYAGGASLSATAVKIAIQQGLDAPDRSARAPSIAV